MKTTMEVFVKYNDKIFTGSVELVHWKRDLPAHKQRKSDSRNSFKSSGQNS
jgi:hypothetical protein